MDDIKNYKLPFYEKSENEKLKIQKSLSSNALFSHIDQEDLNQLYDAMLSKTFSKGETIIQQGDKGDYFYVVDTGICDIWIKFPDKDPIIVKVVKEGDYFGELALMYGTPRAATVKASSESVKLWAIDRMTYRKIVMGQTQSKRELYENFLKKVPLLSSMTNYERLTIADALQIKTFLKDSYIIKEGDQGDDFFILLEGECEVYKNVDGEEKKFRFCFKTWCIFW